MDYKRLSLDEIKQIHKQALLLCNPKHSVFMWTIDKYLFEAEEMMNSLGYHRHARFIWDKGNGVAPAFTVRYSHEYLLWFYPKGQLLKCRKETRGKHTTVLREKSTTHSTKPMCVYIMIEDMFMGLNKLELFA